MTLDQIYANQVRLTKKMAKRSGTVRHADRVEVEDLFADVFIVPDGPDGIAVYVDGDLHKTFPNWGAYETFMIDAENE